MRQCLSGVVCLVALLAGCARPYQPPGLHEPHALVKLRRVYPEPLGPNLQENVRIGGHVVHQSTAMALAGPHTEAIRVRPGVSDWSVSVNYFHRETRWVQEPYLVQEPYQATESYFCGGASSDKSYSGSTCTRSVTRYRSRTQYRTVLQPVDVSDGACRAQASYVHRQGMGYLLQFSFADHGVCHLTCLEQTPRPDGGFTSAPCLPAPPGD